MMSPSLSPLKEIITSYSAVSKAGRSGFEGPLPALTHLSPLPELEFRYRWNPGSFCLCQIQISVERVMDQVTWITVLVLLDWIF